MPTFHQTYTLQNIQTSTLSSPSLNVFEIYLYKNYSYKQTLYNAPCLLKFKMAPNSGEMAYKYPYSADI